MLVFFACTEPSGKDSDPVDSRPDTGSPTTDSDSVPDSEPTETDTDSGGTDTDDSTRIDDAIAEWSASLDGDVVRVAYAPDGSFVVAAGGQAHGRWATDGTQEHTVEGGDWVDVDVAGDASAYAVAGAAGQVSVWAEDETVLDCGLSALSAVSFEPDGTRIAMGGPEGWCLLEADGSLVSSGEEPVLDLAIAPIRGTLVVLGPDGLSAWDSSGAALGSWAIGSMASGRLAFYRDGDNLAVCSTDLAEVWLGRVSSGSFSGWFSATYANDIAFSPDGEWMAIAFETGTLSTVNVLSGEWQWAWTAHEEASTGVAFAPDSSAVVTGGRPAAVTWWTLTYR